VLLQEQRQRGFFQLTRAWSLFRGARRKVHLQGSLSALPSLLLLPWYKAHFGLCMVRERSQICSCPLLFLPHHLHQHLHLPLPQHSHQQRQAPQVRGPVGVPETACERVVWEGRVGDVLGNLPLR
jgi:hypothetical protein